MSSLLDLSGSLCLDDYKIDEKSVGSGSAATCYLARHSRADSCGNMPSELVLKIAKLPSQDKEEERSILQAEVAILSAVQGHPNIVSFYGVALMEQPFWNQGSRYAIQMEMCGGGDLWQAVSKERFTEPTSQKVMIGLLGALDHMHKHGYVHRDVKPENVLMTKDGIPKLADFGISARLSDGVEMARRCGSPGYAGPEMWLSGQQYGAKVDVFAAGALCHFIISAKLCFPGSTLQSIVRKTVLSPVNFRKSVHLERLSEGYKDFIRSLLEKDEDCRPTCKEALSMLAELQQSKECDGDEIECLASKSKRDQSRFNTNLSVFSGSTNNTESSSRYTSNDTESNSRFASNGSATSESRFASNGRRRFASNGSATSESSAHVAAQLQHPFLDREEGIAFCSEFQAAARPHAPREPKPVSSCPAPRRTRIQGFKVLEKVITAMGIQSKPAFSSLSGGGGDCCC